jgi:hypothetical protein
MTSEDEKGSPPGSAGNQHYYGQADQWLSLAASLPALAQNGGLAGLLGGSNGFNCTPAPPISLRDNGFSSAPSGMNYSSTNPDFNSNNKSALPVLPPAPNNNNNNHASNNSGASSLFFPTNNISSEILALLASSLRQQQQPMQPYLPNHSLGGGNTLMHQHNHSTNLNHTNSNHQPPELPWGTEQDLLFNNPNMTSSLDPAAIFAPNNGAASGGGNNAVTLLNSLMPQRQQQPQLLLQQEPQHHQAPTPASASAPAVPPSKREETNKPGLAHRASVLLFMDYDEDNLSEYQCFLRQQIEAFEASPDDVKGTAQGRNTPIQLGQVGIRCRHCASLPKAARPRGAVYYSQKIEGVYQVAQNMSKVHVLGRCSQVPDHTKRKLLELKQFNQRACGGKDYWGDGLRALGIYEDGRCMRFRPRAVSVSPPGQK